MQKPYKFANETYLGSHKIGTMYYDFWLTKANTIRTSWEDSKHSSEYSLDIVEEDAVKGYSWALFVKESLRVNSFLNDPSVSPNAKAAI